MMTGEHRARRARRGRPGWWTVAAVVGAVVLAATGVIVWLTVGNPGQGRPSAAPATLGSTTRRPSAGPGTPTSSSSAQPAPWLAPAPASLRGQLRPGSDPSVLPSMVLIADKLNNRLIVVDQYGRLRWQFPRPGDLAPGQVFKIPDDAFFTPDGRFIIATEEDNYVISVISVATHHIVYRYGVPGSPGSGPNHLDNPDDAIVLPDGAILVADIKNCRLLLISKGSHRPARIYGQTTPLLPARPTGSVGQPQRRIPDA